MNPMTMIYATLFPEECGLVECTHRSGYGSSLKEAAPRCTQCGARSYILEKNWEFS